MRTESFLKKYNRILGQLRDKNQMKNHKVVTFTS